MPPLIWQLFISPSMRGWIGIALFGSAVILIGVRGVKKTALGRSFGRRGAIRFFMAAFEHPEQPESKTGGRAESNE